MSSDVTPAPRRVSALVLALVYLGLLIGCFALFAVLYMVLDQFFAGNSSSNSAMGFLVPMVSAMGVTQFWARREGRPAPGRQWGIALLLALVTLALNAVVLYFIATSGVIPELSFRNGFSNDDLNIAAILAAVLLVVFVLLIRGAFWLGFNGWEKQQKKVHVCTQRQ